MTTHTTPRHALLARLALAAGALAAFSAQPALAQNISIGINQPGVYGRVDIGQPPPQVAWVRPAPVIVQQPAGGYQRQPIYLYVPPAHYNNWNRYCGRYNACAQPVVFVQDKWVRDRHAQYRAGPGRDDDRDGIRNRRDRDRDGDGVRNRNDRDRDGDGVRNSRDNRPNNPNQR
jgi:hypothetical protein